MLKISNRTTLGVVAGLAGTMAKTLVEQALLKLKLPYLSGTAAPERMSQHREAGFSGMMLGSLLDLGTGIIGAFGIVKYLSRSGREHLLVKGLVSGLAMGTTTSFGLNALPVNRVNLLNPVSNIPHLAGNAVYGLTVAGTASLIGDKSLFEPEHAEECMEPAAKASRERREKVVQLKRVRAREGEL